MHDREPAMMKMLLDRLVAARAERDELPRFSRDWHDADARLHAIERAIFRVPIAAPAPLETVADRPPPQVLEWEGSAGSHEPAASERCGERREERAG